jgi:hypothetical protein
MFITKKDENVRSEECKEYEFIAPEFIYDK